MHLQMHQMKWTGFSTNKPENIPPNHFNYYYLLLEVLQLGCVIVNIDFLQSENKLGHDFSMKLSLKHKQKNQHRMQLHLAVESIHPKLQLFKCTYVHITHTDFLYAAFISI